MSTANVYHEKLMFVHNHLSPTPKAATDGQVLGLTYEADLRGNELVICTMRGGHEYVADVSCDSLTAIIKDVMRTLEGHI